MLRWYKKLTSEDRLLLIALTFISLMMLLLLLQEVKPCCDL